MKDPFLEIPGVLGQGKKAVLARIIRQLGSAPRSVGTRCLVLEDGSLMGTIGGGLLEHQVHEEAKHILRDGKSHLLHFQLTGADAAKTAEMLCGGIVDVYLEPLFPQNARVREIYGTVKDLTLKGRGGALLTLVSQGIPHDNEECRTLMGEDGLFMGSISGIERIPQGKMGELLRTRKPGLVALEDQGPLLFLDPLWPQDVLYLFGAGHISTFVASLARMVDFRVAVIDDRDEFANRERFPDADEILVLPFSEAFDHIPVSTSAYLAIVTRGHIHDRTVLQAALQRETVFVGMIGSKRKRDLVYKALLEDGVPKERLAQVHSPIGLDIGAETPEEIAVSIVAELIKVRAETKRQPGP
jgi:xanthine dehydrogenase accessory factor